MKATRLGCVVFALLGLLFAGNASWAIEQACFTASASNNNGIVNVDASASTPANTILSYAWNWGTCLHCTSWGVTSSHTYPSAPPFEVTITLTVNYSNGDYITVTGDTLAWTPPVGPPPPASFTYCSTLWCNYYTGQCSG